MEPHSKDSREEREHGILPAVCAAFLVGLTIAFVLVQLGLLLFESLIFAGLCGLVAGAFLRKEQSLTLRVRALEQDRDRLITRMEGRLESLYADATCPLVQFDAGTLLIERASPGFFGVFGLKADFHATGCLLENVIDADPVQLRSMVSKIADGVIGVCEALDCKRSDGGVVRMRVSGLYIPDQESMEMTFMPVAESASEDSGHSSMSTDLERFRQGMVRRESRILELKSEVNALLKKAGRAPRYKVDLTSKDPPLKSVATGDASKSKHD